MRRSPAEGTPGFRIFTVVSGVTAKVSGLTISGGSSDAGGGILNGDYSTLTVEDSVVSGNSASDGAGGAFGSRGSITRISGSTFSGNSTPNSGGGIYMVSPAGGSITNSTFSSRRGLDLRRNRDGG